jgi:hypothetical protein
MAHISLVQIKNELDGASHGQYSFSTLWDEYETNDEAKTARDKIAREIKSYGTNTIRVRRWTLRNQIRKYASLGNPDGRSCTVYMINWSRAPQRTRMWMGREECLGGTR